MTLLDLATPLGVAGIIAKATLLVAIGWSGTGPLRRAPAVIRHLIIIRTTVAGAALLAALGAVKSAAQKPPAVRPLGRLERTSVDSLTSASVAIPVPGGGVLVNDMTGRRLVLFDSTLTHMKVVVDPTAATANSYGSRQANLIRYRGDSALLIDVVSLSMYVIGPTGSIGRVLAVPRPDDAQALWGDDWGSGASTHGDDWRISEASVRSLG